MKPLWYELQMVVASLPRSSSNFIYYVFLFIFVRECVCVWLSVWGCVVAKRIKNDKDDNIFISSEATYIKQQKFYNR